MFIIVKAICKDEFHWGWTICKLILTLKNQSNIILRVYLLNGHHFSDFGSASVLADEIACLIANGTETAKHSGGSATAKKKMSLFR